MTADLLFYLFLHEIFRTYWNRGLNWEGLSTLYIDGQAIPEKYTDLVNNTVLNVLPYNILSCSKGQ